MDSDKISIVALLAVAVSIMITTYVYKSYQNKKKEETENFDAMGMYYNVPPNWFIKPKYDLRDWIVTQYVDSIQPSCLPYSRAAKYGGMDNINYLASAVRFYRL